MKIGAVMEVDEPMPAFEQISHSKSNNAALKGEWSTPLDLFKSLDSEFHFTLDACAQPFNAKCPKYFTPAQDGLAQNWRGETVFCCPPSGRRNFRLWTEKALQESRKKDTRVVMLLPVSTDAEWFRKNIYHQKGVVIRFLPERVKFTNPVAPSWANGNTDQQGGSMRPTMVVIFNGGSKKFCVE